MITPVTRRDLRDLLGNSWRGRLQDAEFLARLYYLEGLPSDDERYPNMLDDIYQHTANNDDWAHDWIFSDRRLQLDDDERFLRLIAETIHPEVVGEAFDVDRTVSRINALLLPDGFELFAAGAMSGRPCSRGAVLLRGNPPRAFFRRH